MTDTLKNNYCCCQVFDMSTGLYFMGLSLFFYSLYGICLVTSSQYRSYFSIINYCLVVTNILTVPAGLFLLWTALYQSWRLSKISTFLVVKCTIINVAMSCIYFFYYFNFNANSLLDVTLLWRYPNDWVDKDELPFTFWHIFVVAYIILTQVGWYYTYVLCKYTRILRDSLLFESIYLE